MNYKIFISALMPLLIVACSGGFPTSVQPAWQSIDRFQIQNAVAVDTRTGLMWTRCLSGTTWNGYVCEGATGLYSWQQIQHVAKTANYAGYSDWRVPTIDELKSLADNEIITATAKISHLNQAVFPTPNCLGISGSLNSNIHPCWQWTSTPIEGSDHYAWIVYFGYGYGSAHYETDTFALRLVRNNR